MSIVSAISDLPVFGSQAAGPPARATEKQDFLKLLVAQMKYQDPLNPLEGTEFAAQLAQFSSVEELRNIDGKMDAQNQNNLLLAQSVNNTLATTLIGKRVRANDDGVSFDGAKSATIQYNLNTAGQDITVEIVNQDGTAVRTIKVPSASAGDNKVEWDGRDNRGNNVPIGDYQVKITGTALGTGLLTAVPMAIGRIDGISFENGNPVLIMNGRKVPFSSVVQILDTQDSTGSLLGRLLSGV